MRYICPKCEHTGAHPEHLPAPLCHICNYEVTMVPFMTTITPTIVCMYTCKRCGLTKVPVTVPARAAEQDIVEFTKSTVELLGADHCRINPSCPARELDVYIPLPVDESAPIGSATRQ